MFPSSSNKTRKASEPEETKMVDEVGCLTGRLLKRPSRGFYESADVRTGELQKLAFLFCHSDGVASRVDHPRLREAPRCVNSGGHDLGLRIIHDALPFHDEDWTLAVMESDTLSEHACTWIENYRLGLGNHGEPTPQQNEQMRVGSLKVMRHFA